jgi:hypothetical protein
VVFLHGLVGLVSETGRPHLRPRDVSLYDTNPADPAALNAIATSRTVRATGNRRRATKTSPVAPSAHGTLRPIAAPVRRNYSKTATDELAATAEAKSPVATTGSRENKRAAATFEPATAFASFIASAASGPGS